MWALLLIKCITVIVCAAIAAGTINAVTDKIITLRYRQLFQNIIEGEKPRDRFHTKG